MVNLTNQGGFAFVQCSFPYMRQGRKLAMSGIQRDEHDFTDFGSI
jgi:hypothetical protein